MSGIKSVSTPAAPEFDIVNGEFSIQLEQLNIEGIVALSASQLVATRQELLVIDETDDTCAKTVKPGSTLGQFAITLADVSPEVAAQIKPLIIQYIDDLSEDYLAAVPTTFSCKLVHDYGHASSNVLEMQFCVLTSFFYSANRELHLRFSVAAATQGIVDKAFNGDNMVTVRFSKETAAELAANGINVYNEIARALPFTGVVITIV